MPSWRPVKRRELVAALRRAGSTGPYSGGRHEFMQRDDLVLTIPNPHGGDIGITLLHDDSQAGRDHKSEVGEVVGLGSRRLRCVPNAEPILHFSNFGRGG